MTETVYFADLSHTGSIDYCSVFPLGIGNVAAYAKETFGDDITCEIFRFPEDLNRALESQVPRFLCLSNYMWNARLGTAFANRLKDLHPDVIVVMGGPNIPMAPNRRKQFMIDNPAVDFYVKWEGEQAFVELYRALAENGFSADRLRQDRAVIGNVFYVVGDEYVEGPDSRIADLMEVPSPYLNGMFDKFFKQGLRPLVETARGCPYGCTFCHDAHAQRSKVMRRTQEFIREEFEYIASHMVQAADFNVADSNFGMFKDDLDTARIIRSLIDRYGWPKIIYATGGKSQAERVREVGAIINGKQGGYIKIGSSLQSTDDLVLETVKRKNLPFDKLIPLITATADDGNVSFTELILALPHDTKEKHFQSLRDCFDIYGLSVNIYFLSLLPGTPLESEAQRAQFEYNSRFRVFNYGIGIYEILGEETPVAEVEEVVVGTNTMPHEDWVECRVVDLLTRIFLDGEYFGEVFGLIRRLELSSFDLIHHMREHILSKPDYRKFLDLIELFKEKTVAPLYDTLEDLDAFTSDRDNVRKFIADNVGGNEMTIHRAKAHLECNDEIHAALCEAALSYIDGQGRLTDEIVEYVEQATRFSKLRKFDFHDYESEYQDQFTFDFVAAKRKRFQVVPDEVRITPRTIRFQMREETKGRIEYALKTWIGRETASGDVEQNKAREAISNERAQREFELGKLFQTSNLQVLDRTPSFI